MTDPDPDTRRPIEDRGAAWLARQRADPTMAAAMDEEHARNAAWAREMEATMNVRQLMAILAAADPEAPVLVSGYEGGYTTVAAADVCQMQELDRGDVAWMGEFVPPAAAAEEVEPPKPGDWREMLPTPVMVGGPVTAVVIGRSGR